MKLKSILALFVTVATAGILPAATIESQLNSRSGAGDQHSGDIKTEEIYYISSDGETFKLNWMPVDKKRQKARIDDDNNQVDSLNPEDVPDNTNIEVVPQTEEKGGYGRYGGYGEFKNMGIAGFGLKNHDFPVFKSPWITTGKPRPTGKTTPKVIRDNEQLLVPLSDFIRNNANNNHLPTPIPMMGIRNNRLYPLT